MSIASNLHKDFTKVVDYIEKYENEIYESEKRLSLKNKNIQTACMEQASWACYYDQLESELEIICDFLEMKVKEARAKALDRIIKLSKIAHSDRQIDKIIDGDPEYIKVNVLYLEMKELYLKMKSIVDSFEQRGYSLNNIVKIRVSQLEDVTLINV